MPRRCCRGSRAPTSRWPPSKYLRDGRQVALPPILFVVRTRDAVDDPVIRCPLLSVVATDPSSDGPRGMPTTAEQRTVPDGSVSIDKAADKAARDAWLRALQATAPL